MSEGTLTVEALPAFRDNYIWLIRRGAYAAVVDPGDHGPVLDALAAHGLALAAILITHHHADHTGGVGALLAHTRVPVFAPAGERIERASRLVRDGDAIEVPGIDTTFEVIGVPGHTRGHVAYHAPGALFCGDTLFAAGCGRIFEGTAEQMHHSLARLAALPEDTLVYCAHEYTLANLRFALAVEPDNLALAARARHCEDLRARGAPTVPSRLREELDTNPFLRWDAPAVIEAARREGRRAPGSAAGVFAAIRAWKDRY